MKEIWKDIEGYEGYYQVSNQGRVKSLDREENNKKYKGIILIGTINKKNGYCWVDLYKKSKREQCKIHRLVALAFIPNPDNKPEVNHISGIKYDNRLENLEWVTKSENIKHAYKIGLKNPLKGEKHPNSTLSDKQAIYIHNSYKNGKQILKLAREYNVSRTIIYFIVCGKTYKHLNLGKISKNSSLNVKDIKNIYTSKLNTSELSKIYNVTTVCINRIKRGARWSNITRGISQ